MTTRSWPTTILTFSTPPSDEDWEIFCARVMLETDCLGVETLSDDVKRPPEGAPRRARLFFPAQQETTGTAPGLEAAKRLAAESFAEASHDWSFESLPDQDWGVTWRKYFKTIRVGERLYVGPPWEGKLPADAPPGSQLVLIDPGQAFGTGTHETTQLCLRVLETLDLRDVCLMDVGTGSGILGFAALKFGASFVIGTEHDPVCEENFYHNAELNGVRDKVLFILAADPEEALAAAAEHRPPAPKLIVCNMLSEQFRPLMAGLRRMGQTVILSGFLLTEREAVRELAENNGFRVATEQQHGEWGAYVCEIRE